MSNDHSTKVKPAVEDRRHGDKIPDGKLPVSMEELEQAICRRFRVTRHEDREWLTRATAHVRVQFEEYKEEAIQAVVEGLSVRVEIEREEFREKLKELEARILGITEYFEKLIADLQEKIKRDPLTGLYNLPYLHERLDQSLGFNLGSVIALATIDLTQFKFYNDEPGLGHHVGDGVLQVTANTMLKSTRQSEEPGKMLKSARHSEGGGKLDICVRRSGDEFIIAMFGLSSDAEGYVVAQRFKNALREADLMGVLTPEEAATIITKQPLDADIGLAFLSLSNTEEEKRIRRAHPRQIATEWIVKADLAMYVAKRFQSDHPEAIYLRIAPHGGSLLDVFDKDMTVSK